MDTHYPARHIAPLFIRLKLILAKHGFVAPSGGYD